MNTQGRALIYNAGPQFPPTGLARLRKLQEAIWISVQGRSADQISSTGLLRPAVRPVSKVPGEVIDDVTYVILRAVDEGRLAPPEKRSPMAYSPGASTIPPSCRRWPLRSTTGTAASCSPTKPVAQMIERISPLQRRRSSRVDAEARASARTLRRTEVGLARWPLRQRRMCPATGSIFRSAQRNWCEVPRKGARAIAHELPSRPRRTPRWRLRGVEVSVVRSDVRSSCGTAASGARQVVDFVIPLVPDTRGVHPPQHVAPPIRSP